LNSLFETNDCRITLLHTAMMLPTLNPNTPALMDGKARFVERKRSSIWQVVLMMGGRQVRVVTNKRILQQAREVAREIYLAHGFRQKNGLPLISKRFADVATPIRTTMESQLENGVGKKSSHDYIIFID
jgi:hypothetical protein